MANIDIDLEEVRKAELLIQSFLLEKLPEGNFREGSHLHDIVVRAFAAVYALIRSEVTEVRSRQSLLKLEQLTDIASDEVVDEIASNWFITRKTGSNARGTLTVNVSPNITQGQAIIVPENAEFIYSAGITYYLDSDVDMVFSRQDMSPVFTGGTEPSSYQFLIPVVAELPGVAGETASGLFESFSSFGDGLITSVEATSSFTRSTTDETNADLIARAKTAISSRGTVSHRAIDTVLRDEVTAVQEVVVVGSGDSEMYRDYITDVSSGFSIHVLGHVNVYAYLPLAPIAVYPQANSVVQAGLSFVNISSAVVTDFPFMRIRSITSTHTDGEGVEVVETLSRASFYSYTDSDTNTTVYRKSVGDLPTSYSSYTLPQGSSEPTLSSGEYSISYGNPMTSFTSEEGFVVNIAPINFDRTLRIEYQGLSSLPSVDAVLNDRQRRTVSSSVRAYGFYPLVVSMHIRYYSSPDALGSFPTALATASLVSFINTFTKDRALRVGDIIQHLLTNFSSFINGVGLPTEVTYHLDAPDGKVHAYRTQDIISVTDSTLLIEPLTYPATARIPQQVSDRTTRPITFENLITFEEI